MNRRGFLTAMGSLAATAALPYPASPGPALSGPHLGLVTYLWGKDMDLDTLIEHCEKSGLGAVELRTTHAHGVEPALNRQQRKAIKERFANSPVKLLSLGTAEEYNHPEPVRLLQAMEDSRAFIDLARDVGAMGVKVRPNRLYPDIPHEKTIDQIAHCLNELGAYAEGEGQEIYVEVHGEGTSRLPVIRAIFDRVEARNVGACWNCNAEDLLDDGLEANFNLVADRLGLNAVAPFDPAEKVIEYRVAEAPREPLAGTSLRGFIEQLAARTSAPGGGSASAAMAAMGAALGAMVAKLTYGVRKFETVDGAMRQAIPPLHEAVQALIPMVDADTAAFGEYMEGVRMPQETEAEQAARQAKMQAGLKTAVAVPLKTMQLGDKVWESLCLVARHGNPASASDVEVGAKALEAGIWGAYRNVLINLQDVEDAAFKEATRQTAEKLVRRAQDKCAEVLSLLNPRN